MTLRPLVHLGRRLFGQRLVHRRLPEPEERPPEMVGLTVAARILDITPTQLAALVRKGDVPAVRYSARGHFHVPRTWIENKIGRSLTAGETKKTRKNKT